MAKKHPPNSAYWRKKAKNLFMSQFRGRPCAICGTRSQTAGHNLLPQGSHGAYIFDEANILPLCPYHHMFSNEIAAHSTSALVTAAFIDFLKEEHQEKYQWMLQHRKRGTVGYRNYRDLYEELDARLNPAIEDTCATSKVSIDSFVKTEVKPSPTRTT